MNRTEEGTGFTISDFTTTDSSLFGYMLEPGGPATTDSGKDKRIPTAIKNNISTDKPVKLIINEKITKTQTIKQICAYFYRPDAFGPGM